jgi:NAD-dependent SIR2 family protein deacetylase
MVSINNVVKKLVYNNKKFIIFVGAGVPIATGLPKWQSMINSLCNLYPLDDISEKDLENSDRAPEIAQKIYDYLKKNNRINEYYETIKENLQPTDSSYSASELDIALTSNWIITTNFDTTFEAAFKRKYIASLPDFEYTNLFDSESIVYLHGRIDENLIIFKQDDYDKYYPSVSNLKEGCTKDLEEYIKYIFKNYTIVFFGFSFDDKYFKKLLQNIYFDIKNSDELAAEKIGYKAKLDAIQHYAFLKEDKYLVKEENKYMLENIKKKKIGKKRIKKISDLDKIGISTILYKNPITFLNFLETVRELKKKESSLGTTIKDGATEI